VARDQPQPGSFLHKRRRAWERGWPLRFFDWSRPSSSLYLWRLWVGSNCGWMHNPCSGLVDNSQIWGQASDWTVLRYISSEKLDHISLPRKRPQTRAWLAKLSTHRRRNIYVFYTDWSIKRYQMNDMVVYGWSVSCPIFKTKDLLYKGILDRQLCVNNSAFLTVKAQDYNPLWTVKFLLFTLLKLNDQEWLCRKLEV
jgi:hypothetical protein